MSYASEDYPGLTRFVEQSLLEAFLSLKDYAHHFLSIDIFANVSNDIAAYRATISKRLVSLFKQNVIDKQAFDKLNSALNNLDGSAVAHQTYLDTVDSVLSTKPDARMLKNFKRNDSYGFIINHNISINTVTEDCVREGYHFMNHPFTDAEFIDMCSRNNIVCKFNCERIASITYVLYIPCADILRAYKGTSDYSIQETRYFISELLRVADSRLINSAPNSFCKAVLALNNHPEYILVKAVWSDKDKTLVYC